MPGLLLSIYGTKKELLGRELPLEHHLLDSCRQMLLTKQLVQR